METWICAVDSNRGIYGPQFFCENFADYLSESESVQDVLSGPDSETYWDSWDDVERNETLKIDGVEYSIHHDSDIWLVPLTYDWSSHESL